MSGDVANLPLCAVSDCTDECVGMYGMQTLAGLSITVPLCELHWDRIKAS